MPILKLRKSLKIVNNNLFKAVTPTNYIENCFDCMADALQFSICLTATKGNLNKQLYISVNFKKEDGLQKVFL